jgi:eukaryotic-like serine/threonine-protein kinase
MPGKFKKILSSRRAKIVFAILVVIIVLFVLTNDFLLPWYVNRVGVAEVPPVVGMKYEDAMRRLDSLGFEVRKGDVRMDRQHPAGIVTIQNPAAGDTVKKGRRIYLTISGGEIASIVPNIKGRTQRDARFALEHEGLKLGAIEYQVSDNYPAGTIMEQQPAPGARIKREMYVSVTVSQGASTQTIAVPDVTGKMLTEAGNILLRIGLKAGNITYVPSADLLPNTVIDQYPRSGDLLTAGKAVDLIVVQGGEKRKNPTEY